MPPVSAALVVIQPASKPAIPTDLLAGNIFSVDSEFPSAHRTAVWNWPLPPAWHAAQFERHCGPM
jgi:hypothetical protein